MAIISGGKINIWNAVKKQFEIVHPETEVARITDFADGIVQKLALTSAMTAVTALQKDSWFGKLLKMALTASGVKYSIAQNGYVCLGSLFGGLIIQWGYCNGGVSTFVYPIATRDVPDVYVTHLDHSDQVYRDRIAKLQVHDPNRNSAVIASDTGNPEINVLIIGILE